MFALSDVINVMWILTRIGQNRKGGNVISTIRFFRENVMGTVRDITFNVCVLV